MAFGSLFYLIETYCQDDIGKLNHSRQTADPSLHVQMCSEAYKKKFPEERMSLVREPCVKSGGCLLSHLVGQYHRRKRA